MYVHVCTSLISRLFFIEGGNEPGDEVVCTSYKLFLLRRGRVWYFFIMCVMNIPARMP